MDIWPWWLESFTSNEMQLNKKYCYDPTRLSISNNIQISHASYYYLKVKVDCFEFDNMPGALGNHSILFSCKKWWNIKKYTGCLWLMWLFFRPPSCIRQELTVAFFLRTTFN